MPIEFHCSNCGKLLRTPDDSAGRQAKCPACGQTVAVPTATPPEPKRRDDANPFAETTPFPRDEATPPRQEPADSENPYAGPTTLTPGYVAQDQVPGELTPSTVSFDELLRRTWAVFTSQLGQFVLLGLVLVGVGIGISVVSQIFAVLQGLLSVQAPILALVLFIPLDIIWRLFAKTWIQVGTTIYVVKMGRGTRAPLTDVFSGGLYLLRAVVMGILMFLIFFSVLLVCALPTAIAALFQVRQAIVAGLVVGIPTLVITICVFGLMFFVGTFFIVDRDMSAIEAMKASSNFMRGNKGSVFVTVLISSILGLLFAILTCFIGGILFVVPFFTLLPAVGYLSITGQYPDTSR